MTTSTVDLITTPRTTSLAREFWVHASAAHGRALDAGLLDRIDELSDLDIVRHCFADLSDAEQHELLWAYGAFLADRRNGAPPG